MNNPEASMETHISVEKSVLHKRFRVERLMWGRPFSFITYHMIFYLTPWSLCYVVWKTGVIIVPTWLNEEEAEYMGMCLSKGNNGGRALEFIKKQWC